MDTVTRRRFLIASGVGGAGVLGLGSWSLAQLLEKSAREDAARGERVLVIVTLYGGNDGLNTIVPYTDPAYHRARPGLAYAPEKVLRLDDRLGLNPMLRGLHQLWGEGRLGLVLGVGYPRPDRSHFRSMDIWQTAAPEAPIYTGWVGRWLDGTNAPAESAVSFEPVLPPLLVGQSRAGACVNIKGLKLPAGIEHDMIAALGRAEPDESELRMRAATGYADLLRVDRLIRQTEQGGGQPGSPDKPEMLATGTGGGNVLLPQLNLVAKCLEANVPTRVYSVSLGGFDTHAQERAGHERLLKQLDEALTPFMRRVAGRPVTVVVFSEFGRRVRANASDGTDHGTAGPVMVLGEAVAGGFYGEQPSLTDLVDEDLRANVDFRDIFGTVLATVLSADPGKFLMGYEPKLLPLFKTG